MTALYDSLKTWILEQTCPDMPVLLMLSGAQGIGKSTVVKRLGETVPGLVCLGLDDFYLTRAERLILARDIHPLAETRGPPGTHDLALLNETLDQLLNAGPETLTSIPVFSKKLDDRLYEGDWREVRGRPDIILLEGWMIGALPDPSSPDGAILNRIEAQDRKGGWRRWQEDQLERPYAKLWDRADAFFHIHAPSFECVLNWRLQQEAETQGVLLSGLSAEHRKWVSDFILHYERLTRRMLSGHHRSGTIVAVDHNRKVVSETS